MQGMNEMDSCVGGSHLHIVASRRRAYIQSDPCRSEEGRSQPSDTIPSPVTMDSRASSHANGHQQRWIARTWQGMQAGVEGRDKTSSTAMSVGDVVLGHQRQSSRSAKYGPERAAHSINCAKVSFDGIKGFVQARRRK